MTTANADRDLLSTGKLCEICQATPRAIRAAAERANVAPSLQLNGTPYWADAAVAKIQAELRKQ